MASVLVFAGILSSCTIYRTGDITGQPVGTKQGVAKSVSFMNNFRDYSLVSAAKDGDITTIGSWEYSQKVFLFVIIDKTVVTGE